MNPNLRWWCFFNPKVIGEKSSLRSTGVGKHSTLHDLTQIFASTLLGTVMKALQCCKGWHEAFYDNFATRTGCENAASKSAMWKRNSTRVNKMFHGRIPCGFSMSRQDVWRFQQVYCRFGVWSILSFCLALNSRQMLPRTERKREKERTRRRKKSERGKQERSYKQIQLRCAPAHHLSFF